MNKRILTILGIILTVSLLLVPQVWAAEGAGDAADQISIGSDGTVTLTSNHLAQEGVSSLQLTLSGASSFTFNPSLPSQMAHAVNTGEGLTLYIAGSKPLMGSGVNSLTLGTVSPAEGVEVVPGSLQYVYGNRVVAVNHTAGEENSEDEQQISDFRENLAAKLREIEENYSDSLYTPESWAALQEAVNSAQSVYDDPAATAKQLKEAYDKLVEMIGALSESNPVPTLTPGQEDVEPEPTDEWEHNGGGEVHPDPPDDGQGSGAPEPPRPSDPGFSEQTPGTTAPTPIPLATFEIYLIDGNGNPIANASLELLSTPKYAVTNEAGYACFNNVEFGPHTLTYKSSDGKSFGTVSFNLVSGVQAGINGNNVTGVQGSSLQLTVRLGSNGVLDLVKASSNSSNSGNSGNSSNSGNNSNNSNNNTSPQTGDSNPVKVYLMILLVSSLSLNAVWRMNKKRKRMTGEFRIL